MENTENNETIGDLIIKFFPYDNGEDYHTTFELVNNTFSPFQKVDYLIHGIFEEVGLMNKINSNTLKDEGEIKNEKNKIYTNGKMIHPIYKIKKSNNEERDSIDDDHDVYDYDYDDLITYRSRSHTIGGGNKKNKKQHRKTKKNSKK